MPGRSVDFMRLSHATPAIVLRARAYGESDKIVSFLTENHGKVTGIAKGAKRSRKRFANSLEPLSFVNLRFQDRPHGNLVFILAADLLLGFKTLASCLDRIAAASYLAEITDGLIGEREENPLVFRHLKDGLTFLENNGASLAFLTSFELKLLRLAGYQPALEGCKRCGKQHPDGLTGRWYFSVMDGGLLCQRCSGWNRDNPPIGEAALAALTRLQQETDEVSARVSFPTSVLKEIRMILLPFIQFYMDREIRSAPFLHQFCTF